MLLTGGQNKLVLFRVKKNSGGTDYEILSDITGAVVAAAESDAAIILQQTEKTTVSPQEDGTINIDLDQYKLDDDMYQFLDNVNDPAAAASSDLTAVKYENSVEDGGTAEGGTLVLGIMYGAAHSGNSTVNVVAGLYAVARTSGGFEQASGAYSKPSFSLVGKKAEFAITIPAALFDSTIVDATDVGTKIPEIPERASFKRRFVTAA